MGCSANLPSDHPFKSVRPRFGGSQLINLGTTNIPVDPADNVPSMSVYDSPFVLEGSYATSGLDLVYSSSNNSVVTVTSDGKLKPIASGNVTITVTQPGDSHFSAAPSRTFAMKIIDRWPQSLTFAGVGGVAAEVAMNSTVDLNASSSRDCRSTLQ